MKNYLLNCLSAGIQHLIVSDCKPVELSAGHIINRGVLAVKDIYFPTTSVIASIVELDPKHSVGVGLIGCEGMLGAESVLGKGYSPTTLKVIISGEALAIDATVFKSYLHTCTELRQLVFSYLFILSQHNMQNGACCYLHDARQRLARCLLTFSERLHSDKFYLTHETLGSLLATRRSTVSAIANDFLNKGLIRYQRGQIFILNKAGLAKVSCTCFEKENECNHCFLINNSTWRYET